jgi:hypothetical protein
MDGLKTVPFRPYPLLLQRNQGFSAACLTLHKAGALYLGSHPLKGKLACGIVAARGPIRLFAAVITVPNT